MAVESISGRDPEEKIRMLYEMIMSLTIEEQRKLLSLLGGDDGLSGVREPRRPFRPSSSGAVALEVDPDLGWPMPADMEY